MQSFVIYLEYKNYAGKEEKRYFPPKTKKFSYNIR